MSHSSLSSLYNALEHMQRIWECLYLEKCFFLPNQLADKEHACMRESWETFLWFLTNFKMLLCDFCGIYTRIFENWVSKNINSFYYLAILSNKTHSKADWKPLSEPGSKLVVPRSIPTSPNLKWLKFYNIYSVNWRRRITLALFSHHKDTKSWPGSEFTRNFALT